MWIRIEEKCWIRIESIRIHNPVLWYTDSHSAVQTINFFQLLCPLPIPRLSCIAMQSGREAKYLPD
jgi:hypothetical protein